VTTQKLDQRDINGRLVHAARRVIHEDLRLTHGDRALTMRPISTGYTMEVGTPTDFGQAVQAARRLRNSADAMIREYAKAARGAGITWEQLAEPLGITAQNGDPAVWAFESVAEPRARRFDDVTVFWPCAACTMLVTDRGPYDANPSNTERGHADGCSRHAREVAAHEAQWTD
jgi:hypothetical protein